MILPIDLDPGVSIPKIVFPESPMLLASVSGMISPAAEHLAHGLNPVQRFRIGHKFSNSSFKLPIQTSKDRKQESFAAPTTTMLTGVAAGWRARQWRDEREENENIVFNVYSFSAKNTEPRLRTIDELHNAYLGRDPNRPIYSLMESGPTP